MYRRASEELAQGSLQYSLGEVAAWMPHAAANGKLYSFNIRGGITRANQSTHRHV
jgi:hypothetical protein